MTYSHTNDILNPNNLDELLKYENGVFMGLLYNNEHPLNKTQLNEAANRAIELNKYLKAEMLIDYGANITIHNKTLCSAIREGATSLVETFLKTHTIDEVLEVSCAASRACSLKELTMMIVGTKLPMVFTPLDTSIAYKNLAVTQILLKENNVFTNPSYDKASLCISINTLSFNEKMEFSKLIDVIPYSEMSATRPDQCLAGSSTIAKICPEMSSEDQYNQLAYQINARKIGNLEWTPQAFSVHDCVEIVAPLLYMSFEFGRLFGFNVINNPSLFPRDMFAHMREDGVLVWRIEEDLDAGLAPVHTLKQSMLWATQTCIAAKTTEIIVGSFLSEFTLGDMYDYVSYEVYGFMTPVSNTLYRIFSDAHDIYEAVF